MGYGFSDCLPYYWDIETGSTKPRPTITRDRGGVTKYGIAQKWHPNVNVPLLTEAQAAEIIRNDYWIANGIGKLPAEVRFAVFDAFVNHRRAFAQSLRKETSFEQVMQRREREYRRLAAADPEHARQLRGWLNRLKKVRRYTARLLALEGKKPAPPVSHPGAEADGPTFTRERVTGEFTPDAMNPIEDVFPTSPSEIKDLVLTRVKPLWKSKIVWLSGITGGWNAVNAWWASDKTGELLSELVMQPKFLLYSGVALASLAVIWFYWKDHGRGVKE